MRLTIGRSDDNDIVLSDRTVSRQHGELFIGDAGELVFRDLGSSGGTFFMENGEFRRVDETKVRPDDVLRLGKFRSSVSQMLLASKRSDLTIHLIGGDPADGKRATQGNQPFRPGNGVIEVAPPRPSHIPQSGKLQRDPETGGIIPKS